MTIEDYTSFKAPQRRLLVVLAATLATFSGLASNIYFPAIPIMAEAFSTTTDGINLSITSYMVFQAISPMLWGSISDAYGRRMTSIACLTVFCAACIGLACGRRLEQLIILRCLQSFGSASTIAIGSGIIGDIVPKKLRGGYMGYSLAGSLAPLAIGPVLGGGLAQGLGWRSIFWALTIYAGAYLVIVVLFLPETLRSLVGDGSIRPPRYAKAVFEKTVSARGNDASAAKPKAPQIDFLAPLRVLVVPRLAIVLLCLSLHYASWQMALTVQSSLFDTTYGLSEIMIGVTFLANGAGSIIGALVTGRILDRDYRRADKKSKADGVELPLQKVRLRTIVLWAPICWASVLVFGWSIDQRLSIAAPIVVSLLLSWSAMSIQAVISTYIIDVFPDRAASATAALNLARCAMGAVATATVGPAMQRLGTGWTSTLWTGLMAVSSVLLFYCV